MPTLVADGTNYVEVDLIRDWFPTEQGAINQYYGIIRSGKTYTATADIWRLLNSGQIVYANWLVAWPGRDDRKSPLCLILGMLGLWRNYRVYDKRNFHYLDPASLTLEKIAPLTDCHVFLDEGHILLDSYVLTHMNIKDRSMVLHTGHFDRSINVISQRPTAIHATVRGNVNRFYKCETTFKLGRFIRFKKSEIQEMLPTGEIPDPDKVISETIYWARKKILRSYDTKYLRGNTPRSQPNYGQVYRLSFGDKLKYLFKKKVLLEKSK